MSNVTNVHPQYSQFLYEWDQMEDTYAGSRRVKNRGTRYLPATPGQIADGYENGNKNAIADYNAYKMRAHFPDFVNDAVDAALGIMHRKPPVIEVPTAMEDMLVRITPRGETVELLLQRINEAQLTAGRLGLLVDFPEAAAVGTVMPYLAMYEARSIRNWDVGYRDGIETETLNLLVLNESEFERIDTFDWELEKKFRVCVLGDPFANELSGTYSAGVYREDESFTFAETRQFEPNLRGRTIDFIPFTFINSKDLVSDPEEPPLLGLSELALTVYRGEADYRQNLFLQAQDTLVIIGASNDEGTEQMVGANRTIYVPENGDAKFIGVSATGLPEQRQALENDRRIAQAKGAQVLSQDGGGSRESGEALKMRISAQTATLTQVAIAGAKGLEMSLKQAAEWMGLNSDDVSVEPNLEFADDPLTGQLLVQYMQAKNLGLPISLETIHENLRKRDFTDKTFEDEKDKIDEETEEALARIPTTPAGSPIPNQEPPEESPS